MTQEEQYAQVCEELELQREYNKALKQERDEAVRIIKLLHNCRRTCPTILRFAVSAKEILKDAKRWEQ